MRPTRNTQNHEKISKDLEAFLARGGQIQAIPRGVSGETDGLTKTVVDHFEKARQRGKNTAGTVVYAGAER
jgi:hypothetical protein